MEPVARVKKIWEFLRREKQRTDHLQAVWSEDIISDEAARTLLHEVGVKLTKLDMEQVRKDHHTSDFEASSRDPSPLTDDLIRLCKFLSSPTTWEQEHPNLDVLHSIIRQFRFVLPNSGSAEIREAGLSTQKRFPDVPVERISVEELGRRLQRYSNEIVGSDTNNSVHLYVAFSQRVEGIDEFDACVDYPTTVGEGVCRLHATLSHRVLPPETARTYRRLLTATVAGFLTIFSGPWLQLGDKNAYSGLLSFLLPMVGLLISSTTLCSYINALLTETLHSYAIATARTAAKSTAAVLALSTIMLTLGLNDINTSRLPVILAVIVFAGTAMTTIAADHMVNTADARLEELRPSS